MVMNKNKALPPKRDFKQDDVKSDSDEDAVDKTKSMYVRDRFHKDKYEVKDGKLKRHVTYSVYLIMI